MKEKLLDTEIRPFVPFKDVRIPDLGKQYGQFINVFYKNNVKRLDRWNQDFSLVLIKDDFSQITIRDKNKIIITDELINDYNVFNYERIPAGSTKKDF